MRRIKFLFLFVWTLALLAATLWRFPVPLQGASALLSAVAVVVVVVVAAAGVGRSVLMRFKLYHGSLVQEAVFSLGLGLIAFSLWGAALGAAGVYYDWVAWVLVGLALIVNWEHLEAFADALQRNVRGKHPWEGSTTEVLTLLALALSLGTMLVLALAPPSFYDSLVYHLAGAQRTAWLGRSEPQAANLFTWLPSLTEPLWALCLLLNGTPEANALAPSLLNWVVGLALGLAVLDASARLLTERRLWLAPALVLTQPILALSFGVFSPDGWAAWYVFLSLNAFLLAVAERVVRTQAAWLLLSALLAGAAVAAKPVTLLHAATLLVLLALLAVLDKAWRRPGLLLAGLGFFLIPLLPWLLRNAFTLGQPFYPFPVRLFSWTLSQGAPSAYFEHMQSFGGEGWWSWLRLPYALFFNDASLGGGGQMGFLLLALAPVAFFWRLDQPQRWLGAYVLLGGLAWSAGPHVSRYAMALVAPASLLAAHGILEAEAWAVSRTWTYLWRALVLAGLFTGAVHTLAIAQKNFSPLEAALGLTPAEQYLAARNVPQLKAARWIRAHGGERAKILVLGDARTAWLPGNPLAASAFEPHPLQGWVGLCDSPEQVGAMVRRKGYDFVVFNVAEWSRLQQAPASPIYWPAGDDLAKQRFLDWVLLLRALPPDHGLYDGNLLIAQLR